MKKKKNSSTRKKEDKNTQLGLKIKEPFKNKFFKIKGKTDSLLTQLEVRKFLKDLFFWFVLVISLLMVAYQVYIVVINLDNLPSLLPILRYNIAASAKLTSKIHLVIYPTISLISLVTATFLAIKIYNREKFLTKLLLLAALLCCISMTVSLIQLINTF